jgi:hypothetical protein
VTNRQPWLAGQTPLGTFWRLAVAAEDKERGLRKMHGTQQSGQLRLNTTTTDLAVANHWWGHSSGPYHPTLNPGGLGVPVSDHVQFSPYRSQPCRAGLTYAILGRVHGPTDSPQTPDPLPGVTMLLSTGVFTTTNENGYYSFANLQPGRYEIRPLLSGYYFAPVTRTVTLPSDATGQDFIATLVAGPTYSVSGRVTDADGNPIPGVLVYTSSGASALTDIGGNYSLSGVVPGTHTLTAVLAGRTFLPRSRTITVPPNVSGQDFWEGVLRALFVPLVRR